MLVKWYLVGGEEVSTRAELRGFCVFRAYGISIKNPGPRARQTSAEGVASSAPTRDFR
jgi:hypothetical protein